MMKRYSTFAEMGKEPAYKAKARRGLEFMPRVVIVVDELADLMIYAAKRLKRICGGGWNGRAAGMHLVIATKDLADVITDL